MTEKGKKRRKKDGSETVCASSPSQSPSPSDFVHVREMLTKIDDRLFLSDCSIETVDIFRPTPTCRTPHSHTSCLDILDTFY